VQLRGLRAVATEQGRTRRHRELGSPPRPANPKQLQLVATLRNRAGFAQEYPHLELTLTDATDKALLRRALAPADYLPADKPAAAGFAASGELTVSLNLAVRDVAPVGYRLYVFYP
jgi:hypothetical protein